MSWLLDLSPIRFFGFYLALSFLLSTFLRFRQYRTIVAVIGRLPGRWPRLLALVRQHINLFLTWGTVMPLVIVLLLLLANTLASRLLWPHADHFTVGRLLVLWPLLPVVFLLGAAMLALDAYATWNVGAIEQAELEKYFDQAEFWLKSWTAPVVRVFTLGYINPRAMVATEVRAALLNVSQLLNSSLWWVSAQTGLRIAFGLSLWGAFALEPWLKQVLYGG